MAATLRSLAEALAALSDDELAELFAARPDLARPLPSDPAALAQSAASGHSVALACGRLNRLELQVLEVVVAHTAPVDPERVVRAMDPALEGPISAALERCRRLALLWSDGRVLRPVTALRSRFGPEPCGLDPTDRSCRPRISAYLADPGLLEQTLAQAPAGALQALRQLVWGPPRGTVPNALRPVSAETAATPIEWLLARDLLVATGPETVVLPREIALHLRGGRYVEQVSLPPGPPTDPSAPLLADVDEVAGMQALEATRACARMLLEVERGDIRLLRTGGLYQRDAAELARVARVTLEQLALLTDAARGAGLIGPDERTGRLALTRRADQWRALPEPHQWAVLALNWRDSPNHSEPVSRGARLLSEELRADSMAQARSSVLDIAARTEAGAPIDSDRLRTCLDWQQPGTPAIERAPVILAEAEFLGITGRGALSTAGRALCKADTDPAELSRAVRWPPLLDRLVLQADLTATALGPLEPSVEQRMALLADVESTGAGTVYRFSAASLLRAFDSGMATAEVAAELAALSMTGVPDTLAALVSDVGRRHGAVHVAPAACVITTDDDAALAAAMSDRALASLRLHRLAAGVAISPRPAAEVTAALRSAGISAVSSEAQTRRAPRIAAPAPLEVRRFPSADEVAAAVRAVRAGQQARQALADPGRISAANPHDLVAALRDAAGRGQTVWIEFADPAGARRVRQVEPIQLREGIVSGYDLVERRVVALPLSRIRGISRQAD